MNFLTDSHLAKHGFILVEGDNREFAVWSKGNVEIILHQHNPKHLRCWSVIQDNKQIATDLAYTAAFVAARKLLQETEK